MFVARLALHLLSLAAFCALAGCVDPGAGRPPRPVVAAPPPKIAILLPLTGQNAALGRDMLKAAQLALADSGLQLDVRDTGGTPAGAAQAAAASLTDQDAAIVGPLTAGETDAAAGAAGGIPILAFTSDRQMARPGVWPLGVTPDQQVARLVQALHDQSKTRIAAVLPDNAFGNALAAGLTHAVADQGGPDPVIHRYQDGRLPALDHELKDAADYDNRRSAAELGTLPPATEDGQPATPPPFNPATLGPAPFDALLLGAQGGVLQGALNLLPAYGIRLPGTRVIGPATWAREASAQRALTGAWYAAPDPGQRGDFERAFAARYGTPPPPISDVAYDAARLVRGLFLDPAMLRRPSRFAGVDGLIALSPDGQVQRSLAVFEFGPSGPTIVSPAAFPTPGS